MIVEAAQQAAASMHSGKKYPSKHRSPSIKHLHRAQRDLSAFFGPVAAIIGLLGLVSLLVGRSVKRVHALLFTVRMCEKV